MFKTQWVVSLLREGRERPVTFGIFESSTAARWWAENEMDLLDGDTWHLSSIRQVHPVSLPDPC